MGTYLVIMHIVMYVHIHYTILERRTKKKGVDVRTTYTPNVSNHTDQSMIAYLYFMGFRAEIQERISNHEIWRFTER